MIGRGTRRAEGKDGCTILDITGRLPAKATLVDLSDIVGETLVADDDGYERISDDDDDHPPQGHALRDPYGRSKFMWVEYPDAGYPVWFTPVNGSCHAVLAPNPVSGLYRPWLVRKDQPEPVPVGDWAPRRQALADLEATLARANVVTRSLAHRDAGWRTELPSPKQMGWLRRLDQRTWKRANDQGWSKGDVSLAIDAALLREPIQRLMEG
jgi:hypothetical protein